MRFGIYLVCAGGAEAACATLCFGEGGGFLEHSGQVWCNDQLCNAFPVGIEAAKTDNSTDAAETKKDQPQKAENTQENADTTT